MPSVEVAAGDLTTTVRLPTTLWRVVWEEGFGFPKCERRERAQRTYDDPRRVGKMVDTITRMTEHHVLLGVWRADTNWTPVSASTFTATTEDASDDDRDDDATG